MSTCALRSFAGLAALVLTAPALGQAAHWRLSFNAHWSTPGAWDTFNVPDSPSESAVIALPGAYTVTQDVPNLSLGSIVISNPGATLSIAQPIVTLTGAGLVNSGLLTQSVTPVAIRGPLENTPAGRWHVPSGMTVSLYESVVNDGLWVFNPDDQWIGSALRAASDLTINGSGSIIGNNLTISHLGDAWLTLGPYQTLSANGHITAQLENRGLLRTLPGADLRLSMGAMRNHSLITTQGGGRLVVSNVLLEQGADGLLEAVDGAIQFNSTTLEGGTVRAVGRGVTLSGSTFNGVTLEALSGAATPLHLSSSTIQGGTIGTTDGTITLSACQLSGVAIQSSGASTLLFTTSRSALSDVHLNVESVVDRTTLAIGPGAVTNDGLLRLISPNSGDPIAYLEVSGHTLLTGTGITSLDGLSGRSEIVPASSGPATLEIGPDHTLRGRGHVRVPVVNNGRIAGISLDMRHQPVTNNGVMSVESFNLYVRSVDQRNGGVIDAAKGKVWIEGPVLGGELRSDPDGMIIARKAVLTDVISNDRILVYPDSTLTLSGSFFVNNGFLSGDYINDTYPVGNIEITGSVTIDGTGTIDRLLGKISGPPGSALTIGRNQTLKTSAELAVDTVLHGRIDLGMYPDGFFHYLWARHFTITFMPGSRLSVNIYRDDLYNQVYYGTHVIHGGDVDIESVISYVPSLFDRFWIIRTYAPESVTGRFDSLTAPPLPEPWVWKLGYTPTGVYAAVTCPADHNVDLAIDILDFLDYLQDFSDCENAPTPCGTLGDPDLNGDTVTDILDFLGFLDNFSTGC